MNKSVIVQVDESTNGLMKEIQSGISSSIEDSIREVKSKVESVDDNTDSLLRKFKSFDGLSNSIDQLRSLAEESKKFAAIVSPLQNSVSEIKEGSKANGQTLTNALSDIALLMKAVVQVGDNQNKFSSEIKSGIHSVSDMVSEEEKKTKDRLYEVLNKIEQADKNRIDLFNKLDSSLSEIKKTIDGLGQNIDLNSKKIEDLISRLISLSEEFNKIYITNESSHTEFERNAKTQIQNVNESLEKIQATLDIVVNLVTPFWKNLI